MSDDPSGEEPNVEEPSIDVFSMETSRLVALLAFEVRKRRVSVRSLERAMGVGDSVFSKVLKGRITLHVRHVLMICSALGIEWKDFFASAYGMGAAAPAETPPEDKMQEMVQRMVIQVLTQLGIIPPQPPPAGEPSPAAGPSSPVPGAGPSAADG